MSYHCHQGRNRKARLVFFITMKRLVDSEEKLRSWNGIFQNGNPQLGETTSCDTDSKRSHSKKERRTKAIKKKCL